MSPVGSGEGHQDILQHADTENTKDNSAKGIGLVNSIPTEFSFFSVSSAPWYFKILLVSFLSLDGDVLHP